MLEDMHADSSGTLLLPESDVVGHGPGFGVELRVDLNVGPGTQRECIVGTGRVSDRRLNQGSKVRIGHICVTSQAFVLAGEGGQ